MRIAIVPGSFDPMTLGHVNVVERTARIFDRVIVAVMNNESKTYMLSLEERTTLAALSCAHVENVSVLSDSGMLTDLVDKVGACAIVKGIRDEKDLVYEQEMARYNREKNPRAETLYLPCESAFSQVSSTLVRQKIASGAPLNGLLSEAAVSKLAEWGKACPTK